MNINKTIEKLLNEDLSEYSPSLKFESDSHLIVASNNAKSIAICWPYPLMEVFFNFIDNNKIIASESVELYENETDLELVSYIIHIVKRYLSLPSQVNTFGIFFKTTELQVLHNEKWEYIFD